MADENQKVHGNSKESDKLQHVYEIDNIEENVVQKFGISGIPLNEDGSSKRANSQVKDLNFDAGTEKFKAEVLMAEIQGRALALEIERNLIKEYAAMHGGNPDGNKIPKLEITD